MEIVKELDHLYGRKLIENRDIKLKCKNEIVLLYSDLCAFVHSSYKELSSVQSRSVEELESLNFEEDSEMQEICENYVNRTIDAVFFVTLSLFPDISKLPTRFENMGKKFLENSKALRLNWTVKQWKTNIS
jgi:phosphoenolpyruvate synthase/pyruvate phosphate dikinase